MCRIHNSRRLGNYGCHISSSIKPSYIWGSSFIQPMALEGGWIGCEQHKHKVDGSKLLPWPNYFLLCYMIYRTSRQMSYRTIPCLLVEEWSNVREQSIVGCYCPSFSMFWLLNIGNVLDFCLVYLHMLRSFRMSCRDFMHRVSYMLWGLYSIRDEMQIIATWDNLSKIYKAYTHACVVAWHTYSLFFFLVDIGGQKLKEETLSVLLF